jgi:hypothetical protein
VVPVALAAALLAVAPPAPGGDEVPLATLGPRVLREADFREHLAAGRSAEEAAAVARDPAARREALEAWLDAVALAARGRQLGVDREPRFEKARELAARKLLAQLAAERHREQLEGAPVTEEDLRREHARRREDLAVEPWFTARHLVVYAEGNPAFPERGRPDAEARARAEAALARLRAGEGWAAVARAWSDEPGTREQGGLLRDARFEHFAPEVARAARTQPLGVPGAPFRSAFGWHVVEVEARALARTPRPFEEVRAQLAEGLASRRAAAARETFLARARSLVGLRLREAAWSDAPLAQEHAVAPASVLAEVDGRELRESDFRWFLKDALLPSRRADAWARPGARRALLAAFLELEVLAAAAGREGLDRSEAFARRLALAEDALLREFTEAREGGGPAGGCSAGGPGREAERRAFLDRVRERVGLRELSRPTG